MGKKRLLSGEGIVNEILKNIIVPILLGILKITWHKLIKLNWAKGRIAFMLSIIVIFILALYFEIIGPKYAIKAALKNDTSFLIHKTKWVSYDPSDFNPLTGKTPSEKSIKKDLALIKDAGFSGIITFNSNDYMRSVPKIANHYKLNIIVGVWNPKNNSEIANAISVRDYADGYCIGHNGLNREYFYDDLIKAIRLIKFRTLRPVSTTEPMDSYIKDKRLRDIVDWLFPDTCPSFSIEKIVKAENDAAKIITVARALDLENTDFKPILLKMLIYPFNGIEGASYQEQKKFYQIILSSKKNVLTGTPKNVSFSFYGVFDPYWKNSPPFHEWEQFCGLFENDGSPRPALNTIIKYLNYE